MAESNGVLMIDDDQDFRASVRALLEGKGYSCIEASSEDKSLPMSERCKPDVFHLNIVIETSTAEYCVS